MYVTKLRLMSPAGLPQARIACEASIRPGWPSSMASCRHVAANSGIQPTSSSMPLISSRSALAVLTKPGRNSTKWGSSPGRAQHGQIDIFTSDGFGNAAQIGHAGHHFQAWCSLGRQGWPAGGWR